MVKNTLKAQLFFLFLWPCFISIAFALNEQPPLPADQAFRLSYSAQGTSSAMFSWDVEPGYYLYRKKFKLISLSPGITVNQLIVPEGQRKHDEFFGDVEIFRNHVDVILVLQRQLPLTDTVTFEVKYQGCADIGVCYPPIKKTVTLSLPKHDLTELPAHSSIVNDASNFISEQDRIANSIKNQSLWLIALGFLGYGLLMAFTPCTFPMIPILSGIIAGQGTNLNTRRAFVLSLSYVLASSVTYTIFGIIAALFGSSIQAFFQNSWIIIGFSSVFFLLALSMFGLFNIQMPAFIQSKVLAISSKQKGGSVMSAALMGTLSTVIIGPCITAPLAGALIYIGQTGNTVLGGIALFALGIGMGIPLLAIGTSAGKLLPKTGHWMTTIKYIFGIGLLAVAVWLLSRVISPSATLVLWLSLLIMPLLILTWHRIWRGVVLFISIYAILFVIALGTNQTQSLPPLLCNVAAACEVKPSLSFTKVKTKEALLRIQAEAKANGQWVMLDFYADWCVACLEMEHYTFSDPRVQAALDQVVLVQVDVTQNTNENQTLLKHFNLIGPPATLFFAPDQQERINYRLIGFIEPEPFLSHLKKTFGRSSKLKMY